MAQDYQVYEGFTGLGELLGQGKPIGIPDTDRYSGMYLLGVQGVGKSSMLEQLIYQDICKNHAVIIIDPHGDLIEHTIAQMPESKLTKTSLLDIEDTAYP